MSKVSIALNSLLAMERTKTKMASPSAEKFCLLKLHCLVSWLFVKHRMYHCEPLPGVWLKLELCVRTVVTAPMFQKQRMLIESWPCSEANRSGDDCHWKDSLLRMGSRWQRSKIWSSPFPMNTLKKKSTCGTIGTEHLLNTDRRP